MSGHKPGQNTVYPGAEWAPVVSPTRRWDTGSPTPTVQMPGENRQAVMDRVNNGGPNWPTGRDMERRDWEKK